MFPAAGYGMLGSAASNHDQNGWAYHAPRQMETDFAPAAEQQTPIFHQGMLFTIQPRTPAHGGAQLVAADHNRLPDIVAASDAKCGSA